MNVNAPPETVIAIRALLLPSKKHG